MTDEEFSEALRSDVAELTGLYYRVALPDRAGSPELRIMTAIAAGLLDALPGDVGELVLRRLGEAAVDGG